MSEDDVIEYAVVPEPSMQLRKEIVPILIGALGEEPDPQKVLVMLELAVGTLVRNGASVEAVAGYAFRSAMRAAVRFEEYGDEGCLVPGLNRKHDS